MLSVERQLPRSSMAAPGRVETAAVGLPRSRAGVNWKSQSGHEQPIVVTFEFSRIAVIAKSQLDVEVPCLFLSVRSCKFEFHY